MSPEAQRIAIAEACGWEFAPGHPQQLAQNKALGLGWQYINGQHCADGTTLKGVPDYLNDLNAIRDAEDTLSDEQMRKYAQILVDSVITGYDEWSARHNFLLIHTPSGKRAEVFLRAIGKWEES